MHKSSLSSFSLLLLSTVLGGCQMAERMAEVGSAPPLTRVQNPAEVAGYKPVTMPMPAGSQVPFVPQDQSNSLWQTGAKAFFKDQRAKRVGDLLTILINVDDKAKTTNKTERERQSKENMKFPQFFNQQNKWFPNPDQLMDLSNEPSTKGKGSVDRTEKVDTKIAATVMQILPNGNLVIMGRQEMRINYEVREVEIAGVVRPEDIASDNTIPLEKIAEARVSYGGRGQLSDMQHPGIGQEIVDIIAPY